MGANDFSNDLAGIQRSEVRETGRGDRYGFRKAVQWVRRLTPGAKALVFLHVREPRLKPWRT